MLDSIKSAEILKLIGEKLYNARTGYMGLEGKKRSLDKPGISLRDLAKLAHVLLSLRFHILEVVITANCSEAMLPSSMYAGASSYCGTLR